MSVQFIAPLSRGAIQRMLEHAQAHRSMLNHKIAWCCTVPMFGWFGRMERLERAHDAINVEIHAMLRALAQMGFPS